MTDQKQADTIAAFEEEWQSFDYSGARGEQLASVFERYFSVFPWNELPDEAAGFDAGCGTGRWARFVAPRVHRLHLVEPGRVLEVARRNLGHLPNCEFHQGWLENLPFEPGSMDFGYCLGVLHHLPRPEAGMAACAEALKQDAPMLVYLYYDLSDRHPLYRAIWRLTDLVRRGISRLPAGPRKAVCSIIAALVYLPLARLAWLLEKIGIKPDFLPLSFYRDMPFYVMRTDALDRFGTPIEWRYSRADVETLMTGAGFRDITFFDGEPYWCAVGYRA